VLKITTQQRNSVSDESVLGRFCCRDSAFGRWCCCQLFVDTMSPAQHNHNNMLTTPNNSSETPKNAEHSARAVKLRHKRHRRHQHSAAYNVDLVQKHIDTRSIAFKGRAAASEHERTSDDIGGHGRT